MTSNETAGYESVHDGEYVGDAGHRWTANVSVGQRDGLYRAQAYIYEHDQDASREGVRDRIAARGATIAEALDALARVPHGWDEHWATGLARAIAEAREALT